MSARPAAGTSGGMRIVVTGATGNIGMELVEALVADPGVTEVVGVARRAPADWRPARTRFVERDLAREGVRDLLDGVDAVCHLAWAIQPSHDLDAMTRLNVAGSERVFRAAADAGVGCLLHTSSVGAYSTGPRDPDRRVGEDHPTHGIPTSFYSWQKAYAERLLDVVERDAPGMRVVRIRPALVGRYGAASDVRRLFAGPFLPDALAGRLPVTPTPAGLALQMVHAEDVAQGMRRALLADVRGAFNLAAEPVLGPRAIASALGGTAVPVPRALLRAAMDAAWRLRIQPTPVGWLDMTLKAPLLSSVRAHEELGWSPRHDAVATLRAVLRGIREGAGDRTPPTAAGTSGPARVREIATGVGGTSGAASDG